MKEAAKQNGCLFMDGVMFVHSLRNEKLREILNPMRFGEVELVESKFSFRGNEQFFRDNIRVSSRGDPLGCLGDLGWYCIRISLIAFRCNETDGAAYPVSVSATCHKWQDNVPVDMSVTIFFNSESEGWSISRRRSTFHCSFVHGFDQYCRISARANRKGLCDHQITMDDFVIPRNPASASLKLETFGGAFEDLATRVMSNVETYTLPHCHQEERMFSFFAEAIKEKNLSGELMRTSEMYERLTSDMKLTMEICESAMESARNDGQEMLL